MKYLIDTHTFLWFSEGSEGLSELAKNLIRDTKNEVFLSIVSLWEISIKTALGKLSIQGSYDLILEDVVENDIQILSLNFAHTVRQNNLPFHHKAPFDRMIISQSLVEEMDVISKDVQFDNYFAYQKQKRIW